MEYFYLSNPEKKVQQRFLIFQTPFHSKGRIEFFFGQIPESLKILPIKPLDFLETEFLMKLANVVQCVKTFANDCIANNINVFV